MQLINNEHAGLSFLSSLKSAVDYIGKEMKLSYTIGYFYPVRLDPFKYAPIIPILIIRISSGHFHT